MSVNDVYVVSPHENHYSMINSVATPRSLSMHTAGVQWPTFTMNERQIHGQNGSDFFSLARANTCVNGSCYGAINAVSAACVPRVFHGWPSKQSLAVGVILSFIMGYAEHVHLMGLS